MKRITPMLVFAAALLATSALWATAPVGRYAVGTDTVKDNETGLTWQRAVPAQTYDWANAKTYCQGLSLGGFASGWRLPSKKELETLVDFGVAKPGPTVDSTAFPGAPAQAFWTSTSLAWSADYAWTVDFGYGGSLGYVTTDTDRVRCVH
jgi:hypothetical protein